MKSTQVSPLWSSPFTTGEFLSSMAILTICSFYWFTWGIVFKMRTSSAQMYFLQLCVLCVQLWHFCGTSMGLKIGLGNVLMYWKWRYETQLSSNFLFHLCWWLNYLGINFVIRMNINSCFCLFSLWVSGIQWYYSSNLWQDPLTFFCGVQYKFWPCEKLTKVCLVLSLCILKFKHKVYFFQGTIQNQ